MRRTIDFRDQLIAAPLKRIDVGSVAAALRAFPRSIDRGPIEAARSRIGRSRTLDFRDQLIAAPLKPTSAASDVTALAFPRSIDRGPIEALAACPALPRGRAFPRSIDRGPIEASTAAIVPCAIGAFPRSIDRGPIEALTRRRTAIGRSQHFRDQLIAAPLKPTVRGIA